MDVDVVTSRRAEADRFDVRVDATYVKDDSGNILTDLAITFDLQFPAGPEGDKARDRVPGAVALSHDKTCTVSRTLEARSPVTTTIL